MDGDIIIVQFQGKTETLRILGVDTPEISKENSPYEYKTNNLECVREWGYKAKDFTYSMLKGKDVQIEFDEKAGLRDSFGRLLAYVYIDGKDFGKMLVEKGYARVYVEGEFSKESEYIKAEEEAFNSDVGVWSCREVIQTPTPTLIQTVTVVPEEIKEYIVKNYGDGKCITKDTGDKLGLACLTDNLAKPLPSGYTKDDICSEEVLKWTYDNVGWCIETTPPPATEKIGHQTVIVITTITPTPLPTTTLTPTPTQSVKETPPPAPIPTVPPSLTEVNKVIIYALDQNPAGYDSGKEWIMLYNPLDHYVNIEGWKIKIRPCLSQGSSHIIEIPEGSIIAPWSYWVYVHPTELLNDSIIEVILLDANNNRIDSVIVGPDNEDDNRYWYRISSSSTAFSKTSVEDVPPSPPPQVPIPEIKIEYIHFNAPGNDRYNLNGEYVVIKNYEDEAVNLKGWKLRDEYGHTYVFPSVTIPSGGTITIYTGSGTDTETELYWGSDWPIWNNDGDSAYLYDSYGRLVDTYSYSGFS